MSPEPQILFAGTQLSLHSGRAHCCLPHRLMTVMMMGDNMCLHLASNWDERIGTQASREAARASSSEVITLPLALKKVRSFPNKKKFF